MSFVEKIQYKDEFLSEVNINQKHKCVVGKSIANIYAQKILTR